MPRRLHELAVAVELVRARLPLRGMVDLAFCLPGTESCPHRGSVTDHGFSRERLLRLFTKAPKAYFRHDVDVSLDAAVQMARFAQLAGIKSTFYVRVTGEEYNVFSLAGEHALERIADYGHRIGLHVDERCAASPLIAWRQARRLVEATDVPIDVHAVSFHMPTAAVLWKDYDSFESAYARKWEGRYVADSRREFGPEKEALVQDGWQVGLHPEWWFG